MDDEKLRELIDEIRACRFIKLFKKFKIIPGKILYKILYLIYTINIY